MNTLHVCFWDIIDAANAVTRQFTLPEHAPGSAPSLINLSRRDSFLTVVFHIGVRRINELDEFADPCAGCHSAPLVIEALRGTRSLFTTKRFRNSHNLANSFLFSEFFHQPGSFILVVSDYWNRDVPPV